MNVLSATPADNGKAVVDTGKDSLSTNITPTEYGELQEMPSVPNTRTST